MPLRRNSLLPLATGLFCLLSNQPTMANPDFEMTLRRRVVDEAGQSRSEYQTERWAPEKTAVIVCDMWDAHHCLNAVRRATEMAPRMNQVLHHARDCGATIIHAPSSCMDFYKNHPARRRAQAAPQAANLPEGIDQWLNWIDDREKAAGYPIDATDGGEDDDPVEHQKWADELTERGRNPRSPWVRQMAALDILDTDFITDNGVENWNILQSQGIENVILVGVHTNMCVLGRPFGLRQLAKNGKNVVLMRDLTDTMYNPSLKPHVSHFRGTDLIIDHVETFVCPTVSSDQLLGDAPFRFSGDPRKSLVMLIGEREYDTETSLPRFAEKHLLRRFKVTYIHANANSRNDFPGIKAVRSADVVLVSVRRRALPTDQLAVLQSYVNLGRPIVGIRTASHAFALRDKEPPAGRAVWPEFDKWVFGGNYTGHHGNKVGDGETHETSYVWNVPSLSSPILDGVPDGERITTSHMYKTSPLASGTQILMMGRVGDRKPHEPVAWTFRRDDGGRSFYTSLGSKEDFADPSFQRLLENGIQWAASSVKR